jgi:hypothetical protein
LFLFLFVFSDFFLLSQPSVSIVPSPATPDDKRAAIASEWGLENTNSSTVELMIRRRQQLKRLRQRKDKARALADPTVRLERFKRSAAAAADKPPLASSAAAGRSGHGAGTRAAGNYRERAHGPSAFGGGGGGVGGSGVPPPSPSVASSSGQHHQQDASSAWELQSVHSDASSAAAGLPTIGRAGSRAASSARSSSSLNSRSSSAASGATPSLPLIAGRHSLSGAAISSGMRRPSPPSSRR